MFSKVTGTTLRWFRLNPVGLGFQAGRITPEQSGHPRSPLSASAETVQLDYTAAVPMIGAGADAAAPHLTWSDKTA